MVIERLKAYSGSVRELARLAEVSPGTILALRDGSNDNPRLKTMRAIEAALDQLENSPQPSERHTTEAGGEPGGGAHSPSSAGDRAVGARA